MRARTTILVVAAAALAVGFGGYGLWLIVQPPDSIGWCSGALEVGHVTYSGNQSGFLNFSWGPVPLYCEAAHVAPGSAMSLPLFVHNMDPSNAHSVLAIGLSSGFSLVATSPETPAMIVAGGNVTFSVTFDVPRSPGTYSPSADLSAS